MLDQIGGINGFTGLLGGHIIISPDTVFENKILQHAFPGLVADRAIQGMLNQESLQRFLTHAQYTVRISGNHHAVCNRGRASFHWLVHSTDFHNAHPARPDGIQPFVVTEGRYLHPSASRRIQDRGVRFADNFSAVDRYFNRTHIPLPSLMSGGIQHCLIMHNYITITPEASSGTFI
jgi:hypothetical protein